MSSQNNQNTGKTKDESQKDQGHDRDRRMFDGSLDGDRDCCGVSVKLRKNAKG